MLMAGLTAGFIATSVPKFFFGIADPVFGMFTVCPVFGMLAACYLIMATGRLQVREKGIWQYWRLLRWGKIGSYRWANDRILVVEAKGPLSLLQGALRFPPEQKQAVDELLTKHRPAQATA